MKEQRDDSSDEDPDDTVNKTLLSQSIREHDNPGNDEDINYIV